MRLLVRAARPLTRGSTSNFDNSRFPNTNSQKDSVRGRSFSRARRVLCVRHFLHPISHAEAQ
jgi:hypothetical protein